MVSEHINFVTTTVSELMVSVQDSNALDEAENVESMEFDRGIKMKKTTKKSSDLF